MWLADVGQVILVIEDGEACIEGIGEYQTNWKHGKSRRHIHIT